jgi:hypothetical protein
MSIAIACRACGSDKLKTFNGEIAIDVPGSQERDKSIVWVFRTVWACLNCGVAEFDIPHADLSVLADERSRGAA